MGGRHKRTHNLFTERHTTLWAKISTLIQQDVRAIPKLVVASIELLNDQSRQSGQICP